MSNTRHILCTWLAFCLVALAGCSDSSSDGCTADVKVECVRGYMNGDAGVCEDEAVDSTTSATCAGGTWSCPSDYLVKSVCTQTKCKADLQLPSGPCQQPAGFSCTGYVYPWTSVSCTCTGTWQCLL